VAIPGIYKFNTYSGEDIELLTPDYIGCEDSITAEESISELYDYRIRETAMQYYPDVFIEDKQYSVFPILLSNVLTSVDGISNSILTAYDFNQCSNDVIYKLATLYNINYPLDYNIDKLRLLVKYYAYILKRRGTIQAIKDICRIIDRSEADMYNGDFADDTEVIKIDIGYYDIINTRITSKEFAKYLLFDKIRRTGLKFYFNGEGE
jgi:hypothetical protein